LFANVCKNWSSFIEDITKKQFVSFYALESNSKFSVIDADTTGMFLKTTMILFTNILNFQYSPWVPKIAP